MTDPDAVAEPYAFVVAEGIRRIHEDEPAEAHKWLYEAMRDLAATRGRPGDMATVSDWIGVLSMALAAARHDVPFVEAVAWFRREQNPPPDPWLVDEVAVRLACDGERIRLTNAEQRVAVERLTKQGLTVEEITRRLRMGRDRVERFLGKGKEAA